MSASADDEHQIINKFGVQLKDLVDLVELYRNRTFDEDLKALKLEYDGVEGLATKL
jgi:hypothetical protein